jgi:hypothetical protein
MNGKDPWYENTQRDSDSGPIAIGEIMPAVLARYGLAGDEPDEDIPVVAEWPPVAGVLVEA